MSRLEQATERLQSAIERLEEAAAKRNSPSELETALEQAREEKDVLRDVNTMVSRRLDAAISRLKAALES
jgi:DNA replication initiation complex subunit (GINS family)